ncbi:MAG: hypothetical protein ABSD38_27220 [Syntrophorhabdales bacterium]|jgi:hypothetical protein
MAYITMGGEKREIRRVVIHGDEMNSKFFEQIKLPSQEYPYWELQIAEGGVMNVTGDVLIAYD